MVKGVSSSIFSISASFSHSSSLTIQLSQSTYVRGQLIGEKDITNYIVDTGTTLIVIPPAEAEAFFAKVPRSQPFQNGYYKYPCNIKWAASFSLGGSDKQFTVSSEFMNLGLTEAGSSWCVAAVAVADVGVNAIIVRCSLCFPRIRADHPFSLSFLPPVFTDPFLLHASRSLTAW